MKRKSQWKEEKPVEEEKNLGGRGEGFITNGLLLSSEGKKNSGDHGRSQGGAAPRGLIRYGAPFASCSSGPVAQWHSGSVPALYWRGSWRYRGGLVVVASS